MKRSKILILDDERDGIQHLNDALSLKHDLVWGRKISDAIQLLDNPNSNFDLIICGIHLLHESMFDFLRQVRSQAANKQVPFICFRIASTQFAENMDKNIQKSAKLLGANGYVIIEDTEDPETLLKTVESKIGTLVPELKAQK